MAVYEVTGSSHRAWDGHPDSEAVLFHISKDGQKFIKMEIPVACFNLLTDTQIQTALQSSVSGCILTLSGVHPTTDPLIESRAASFHGFNPTG